jgi:hypothetical protein
MLMLGSSESLPALSLPAFLFAPVSQSVLDTTGPEHSLPRIAADFHACLGPTARGGKGRFPELGSVSAL